MHWLAALIYYGILTPLSWLPFWVLNVKAYTLGFLLFRVIGYRKQVIYDNVKGSFPEKSEAEVKQIIRQFERHFMRIFLTETIKTISLTENQIKQRITLKNVEALEPLFQKQRNLVVYMGHFGNWEWITLIKKFPTYKNNLGALYKVQSRIANDLMKKIRGKNGIDLIPAEKAVEYMKQTHDTPTSLLFIGDQSPPKPHYAYWTQFLNRETGVITGTERMSQRYKWPVVYASFIPNGANKYTLTFQVVTENPQETEQGEITEKCTRLLEKDIQETPHAWLWSHKRWKHKKPVANG